MLIPLNRVRANDVPLVGGKGANLGELAVAGFPVPDGFCVTADAYRRAVAPFLDRLLKLVMVGDHEAVRTLVAEAPLPEGLAAQVDAALAALGPVAVRSSATAEDLPEASFAGQQETFLGVAGCDTVLSAIRHCWASLWTDRAITYRARNGFAHDAVQLAVVVQSMVAADSAGVAFTADPVTGRRDDVVIDASWGLGESVVSGTVTPDSFVVRSGRLTQRRPGDKPTRIDLRANGAAETTNVAERSRRALCVSDRDALRVARLARDVKAHYATPMDIEWAIAGGELWLLQARPITTVTTAPAPDTPGGRRPSRLSRFIRTDIIEHFPGPHPLDVSMARMVVRVLHQSFHVMGLRFYPQDLVSLDDDGVARLAYPQVSMWGIPLGVIRFLRRPQPDPRTWGTTHGAQVRAAIAKFAALDARSLSNRELADTFTQIVDTAETTTRIRFVDYLAAYGVCGIKLNLMLRLARVATTQFDLLGDLDYATVIIDRRIQELANSAPPEARLNSDQNLDVAAIQEADPHWWETVEDFLAAYGARSTRTYEPFSTRAWREDLPGFLRLLATMGRSPGEAPSPQRSHEQIVTEAALRLPRLLRSHFFRLVDKYRAGYVMREASVIDLEELCAALRRIGLEAGRRMQEADLLAAPDEVKFLSEGELLAWLRGTPVDIAGIVARRRRARPLAEPAWYAGVDDGDGDAMSGVAASPGRAVGIARVITDPTDFQRLQPGDVLVCRATNPAWTPLFALASAVVAETGGQLSHAAIVAREYAIPAVLGVPGATNSIADGQLITVDGSQGRVLPGG